jgi:hypothetical protein
MKSYPMKEVISIVLMRKGCHILLTVLFTDAPGRLLFTDAPGRLLFKDAPGRLLFNDAPGRLLFKDTLGCPLGDTTHQFFFFFFEVRGTCCKQFCLFWLPRAVDFKVSCS